MQTRPAGTSNDHLRPVRVVTLSTVHHIHSIDMYKAQKHTWAGRKNEKGEEEAERQQEDAHRTSPKYPLFAILS